MNFATLFKVLLVFWSFLIFLRLIFYSPQKMPTFKEAAEQVKKLKSSPSNDELLQLYALYKQATVGDNNTDKPGMFDLKGKAKWAAWGEKKGTSENEAKIAYIELVSQLVEKYGLQ